MASSAVLAKELIGRQGETKELNTLFSPCSFVDESTFICKNGVIGKLLNVRGISAESMTAHSLESISGRLFASLSRLGSEYRVMQYCWRHSGNEIEGNEYTGPVQETVSHRRKFLSERSANNQLFELDIYWAILYEPASKGKHSASLSSRKITRVARHRLEKNIAKLTGKVNALAADLSDVIAPKVQSKYEAFQFFRVLGNLDSDVAELTKLPEEESYIDHLIGDQDIHTGRDGIKVGRNHVEVLTARQCPKKTEPNLLRDLYRSKCDFILVTEFKQMDHTAAISKIETAKSSFVTSATMNNIWSTAVRVVGETLFGKSEKSEIKEDPGSLANVDELNQLLLALNKGDELGEFSLTLLLYSRSLSILEDGVSEAIKAFSRTQGSLVRETYNGPNAFLAIQPGNQAFNFRRIYYLLSDSVDMALAYQRDSGQKLNSHLGAESLLVCETEDGTPHNLNLHHEGVLGAFVSGKTGSGKSVLSNVMLDNYQKYEPITLILDVGGSYRSICNKYDGTYMSLVDLNFHANPFGLENSARTRRFLSAFVRILLENEGYRPNYTDTRIIFESVEELMDRPDSERRLGNLKLPSELRAALYRWIGRGEYGSVFDNIEDDVSFSNFKVFDFQGIEESPEISEPLFFYLFMRHERIIQDPALLTKLKIFWVDEAHRFLANATCRDQFVKAGKTYRKHNAGIVLTTQSPFDFKKWGIFELVSEVRPTKILLANPSADMAAYQEMFHLNEEELKLFRRLKGKGQFFLKYEENPGQVLNLNLSPFELVNYRNDPYGNEQRNQYQAKYGKIEGLKILAREIEQGEAKAC